MKQRSGLVQQTISKDEVTQPLWMSVLGFDLPCRYFFFLMHKIEISHCNSCPWPLRLEENYVGFQLRKAKLVFKDCNSL